MEKMVFTLEYAVLLRLLRDTRKAAGLTQTQLAEKLKENQSWVLKYERGEHRLDVLELRIICQGLGVTLPEFVEKLEAALPQKKGE